MNGQVLWMHGTNARKRLSMLLTLYVSMSYSSRAEWSVVLTGGSDEQKNTSGTDQR